MNALLQHSADLCREYAAAVRVALQKTPINFSTAPRGRMGIPGLIDLGIDGYLWPEEAAKLYELTYRTPGDVLELGTYCGLSAYIISTALAHRGHGVLHTCDIDPLFSQRARRTLSLHIGRRCIRFHVDEATRFLDREIAHGRKYGFAFIDHWHGYDATVEAIERIPRLLNPGGYVMFHDYNDPPSDDPANQVRQAVDNTIARDARFWLCGVAMMSAAVFQLKA